jgi:hypothetical protein
MPEEVVQPQPAQTTVLHFKWPDGQPAAGLTVRTLPFLNEGIYTNFESKTGPDGRLVWSNAPVKIVSVAWTFPGPELRTVSVWAGHTQTVTLSSQPPDEVIVAVRVTDARTRKPLDTFELGLADLDQQSPSPSFCGRWGPTVSPKRKLRRADFKETAWPRSAPLPKVICPDP